MTPRHHMSQELLHQLCIALTFVHGTQLQVRLLPPIASYMDKLSSLASFSAGIETCLCGGQPQLFADVFLQDIAVGKSALPKLPLPGKPRSGPLILPQALLLTSTYCQHPSAALPGF